MRILFIAFLVSTSVFGQKMPEDYFEEAATFYEQKNYDEALKSFKYIVDNHPKNELYPRAFYNVGCIYFLQKNYKDAITVFEGILHSNFNEKERLGGDIMGDPFANYKHRASEILSDIYFEQGNYKKALEYFELSDTEHPYLHFCGNEYAYNTVQTALRYSEIYCKLNKPDKAIEKLLPVVFITLTDNDEVIRELKTLLSGKKEIKKELDEALSKIYAKSSEYNGESYETYYFKFLNTEIKVPYAAVEDEPSTDKAVMIKTIKASAFYKMIEEL